jgi:hypothetical protein
VGVLIANTVIAGYRTTGVWAQEDWGDLLVSASGEEVVLSGAPHPQGGRKKRDSLREQGRGFRGTLV